MLSAVPIDSPIPTKEKRRTDEDSIQILYRAHTDAKKAFDRYAGYYLSTNGQVYWSDLHHLCFYPDNCHREIDEQAPRSLPCDRDDRRNRRPKIRRWKDSLMRCEKIFARIESS